MTDPITAIRERLAEIDVERDKLLAAQKLLEAPEPKTSARKPAASSRKAPMTPTKLVEIITEQPGLTNSQLSKVTGGKSVTQLTMLKKAEAEGKVRHEGELRAMKWFPPAA